MKPVSLLILTIFLVGCVVPIPTNMPNRVAGFVLDAKYRNWAADFARRQPVSEARLHFERGDYSIFSVQGNVTSYPGVSYDSSRFLISRYPATLLPETREDVATDPQQQYIAAATAFAAAYNQELVRLLRQSGRIPAAVD